MDLRSVALDVLKMSARSIVLTSGMPAMLELSSGPRYSKQPISHHDLTTALLDVAPDRFHTEIRSGKSPGTFPLTVGGLQFVIAVSSALDAWRITVRRDDGMARHGEEVGSPARTGPTNIRTTLGGGSSKPADPAPWETSLDGQRSLSASSISGGYAAATPNGLPSPTTSGSFPRIVAAVPGSTPAATVIAPPTSSPTPAAIPSTGFIPLNMPTPVTAHIAPGTTFPDSRPVQADDLEVSTDAKEVLEDVEAVPIQPPAQRAEASVECRDEPDPELIQLLDIVVRDGASDLHLSAGIAPRYRILGDIRTIPDSSVQSHKRVISMLRSILPKRARHEFETENDTDFAYSTPSGYRFRVNAGCENLGAYSVMRYIPSRILSPEELGIPKKVLDLCWLTKGLVLVTGPTGSGKSTTLAAMIDFINGSRADHIITIEDPIEYIHPKDKRCLVRQREVGEHTSSFKRALKAALREDPNIVLVGEMRDLETVAIAIEIAYTGHLVFGTLHTMTAASAVDRIIDQFPADQQAQVRTMLSESLRGVIAQSLCKKVGGGRIAAYEVLIGNRAVSNLIRESKTFQMYSLIQTSKSVGMCTLNEALLTHVKAKMVAPEEAYLKAFDRVELKALFEKHNIRNKLPEILDEGT